MAATIGTVHVAGTQRASFQIAKLVEQEQGVGAEATGDLAEAGRESVVALGGVNGGRHAALGHEGEEAIAAFAIAHSEALDRDRMRVREA